MIRRLAVLFGRAKRIFQTEGWIPLLKQSLKFFVGLFFQYKTYYLYEYRFKEMNETDFVPKIHDFTFKIVSTNQEADRLVPNGFEFRSFNSVFRERLDKGAIAFCIFIGRELAHIGWVAMNEEARKSILTLPLRVNFSNNESFIGGIITMPKYQGKGLMAYGLLKRLQFLREKGVMVSRHIIAKNNVVSRTVVENSGYNRYGEARYLRILWWKSWKENPLTHMS